LRQPEILPFFRKPLLSNGLFSFMAMPHAVIRRPISIGIERSENGFHRPDLPEFPVARETRSDTVALVGRTPATDDAHPEFLMAYHLITKPTGWFKTNLQPRQHFDEAELRQLGESIRVKQLQPVLARPDGSLIAGERRLRAARLAGLESLQVIVTDEPLTESQIRIIQLTENIHRADLTAYEQWQACEELLRLNPDWQAKDLAAHLHKDPSMVTRLLSPGRCIPEAQAALREGRLGIRACYELSQLPPDEQPALLAVKLGGGSVEDMARQRRQRRNGQAPAVRASRIRCPLPTGVVITASGADLSLEDFIDALSAALKEARRAVETGLDSKTFQAVAKDKAKAGE
jgi:ParB family chromosome partitioning protein